MIRLAQGVVALALIVVGVWFLVSWPAALIAGGVLLIVDRLT